SGALSLDHFSILWQPVRGPSREILYEEMWSASFVGRGWSESLRLQSRLQGLDITLSKRSFPSPEVAETVLKEVLERVAKLPEGQQLLERIASRKAVATHMATGKAVVSPVLAVSLALVFLLEVGVGALNDPARL